MYTYTLIIIVHDNKQTVVIKLISFEKGVSKEFIESLS